MAQIVGGGRPVNDAERRVIAHLRDNAPDDWLLLHNIEVPRGPTCSRWTWSCSPATPLSWST